jgi:hypothetical protein
MQFLRSARTFVRTPLLLISLLAFGLVGVSCKKDSSNIDSSQYDVADRTFACLPHLTGLLKADGTEATQVFCQGGNAALDSLPWDEILSFEGQTARARWGNGWGLIDTLGVWIMLPRAKSIGLDRNGLRLLQFQDSITWIQANGQALNWGRFDSGSDFQGPWAAACLGGRCGWISRQGQWNPNPKWSGLYPIGDTLWAYQQWGQNLWGVVTEQGQVLIPPFADSLDFASPQRGFKAKLAGQWGVRSPEGPWLISADAADLILVDSMTYAKQLPNQTWSLLSLRGGDRAKVGFSWFGPCQSGTHPTCVACKEQACGIYSPTQQWVVPPKYSAIDSIGQGWWRLWDGLQDTSTTWSWTLWNVQSKQVARGALALEPMIAQAPSETDPLAVIDAPTPEPEVKRQIKNRRIDAQKWRRSPLPLEPLEPAKREVIEESNSFY